MLSYWHIFLTLIRYKLSIAVSISAYIGYIAHTSSNYKALGFMCLGVFLLSGAASILNQIQEKEFDAKMNRTKLRPIPQKKITITNSRIIAAILLILGLYSLLSVNSISALLGLLTIFIYNVIYTKLKPITSLAILPGALVGAIPPIIGWTAAGGNILHPTIVFISTFMLLWQVPHFFLLAIKYKHEYEKAGFSIVAKKLSEPQLKRILYLWLVTTSLSTFLFPLFGITASILSLLLLSILNIGLIVFFFIYSFGQKHNLKSQTPQIIIHIYMLVFYIIIAVETGFL